MQHTLIIEASIGKIEIVSSHTHINSIKFINDNNLSFGEIYHSSETPDVLKNCANQLMEYFKGQRKSFDFPISQEGTIFQQEVWKELLKIPYGKTISYLELAIKLGDKKKIRAVAAANGANNLAIIVPCHRVIGKDGKLVGYAGGLWRKKFLLNLEFENSTREDTLF